MTDVEGCEAYSVSVGTSYQDAGGMTALQNPYKSRAGKVAQCCRWSLKLKSPRTQIIGFQGPSTNDIIVFGS